MFGLIVEAAVRSMTRVEEEVAAPTIVPARVALALPAHAFMLSHALHLVVVEKRHDQARGLVLVPVLGLCRVLAPLPRRFGGGAEACTVASDFMTVFT